MDRDFKYFAADVQRHQKQIADYLARNAPRIMGKEAVDHFKGNFTRQNFDGQRWREVKRRMPPAQKGVAGRRKILHGETLELMNSIAFYPGVRKAVIFSDKVYAGVHNEGLRAGRGKGFKMPKRQFMGPSVRLNKKVLKRFEKDLNNILKA